MFFQQWNEKELFWCDFLGKTIGKFSVKSRENLWFSFFVVFIFGFFFVDFFDRFFGCSEKWFLLGRKGKNCRFCFVFFKCNGLNPFEIGIAKNSAPIIEGFLLFDFYVMYNIFL